jgi:hypothetical protein
VLRVIDVLAAEEHDLPFQERGANLFDGAVGQRLLQLDAEDLGAREDRHRSDFDGARGSARGNR